MIVDVSNNKAPYKTYLFGSFQQEQDKHTLTMGPGGPLGPDGPSFPGGPYIKTTYSYKCVTTHRGPCSCNTSMS